MLDMRWRVAADGGADAPAASKIHIYVIPEKATTGTVSLVADEPQ